MSYTVERIYGIPIRTVPPTILPVTIEAAKQECDVWDDNSVNDRFRDLIVRATDQVERHSRKALMTQTWKMHLDRFPCEAIELRKCPVQSVTHIKYYTGGVLTTWSASLYQSDLISEPARIEPVTGQSWPSVDYDRLNAVEVQWVAGYATQVDLAKFLPCAKSAVLLAVRGLYTNCGMSSNYWDMINTFKAIGFVA